jgi:tetratricopeptide (TPR) repeat protein
MNMRKFYRFITIASCAFWLVSCASKVETEPVSNKPGVSPAEAIAKAETLFKEREDVSKLREAVQTLAAARDMNNRNYEIEWKFSRFNYFLGKYATDEKESEKAFENGIAAGKIASRMEPGKPDGYFWYGANLGEQAKRSQVTVGYTSIDDIREAMNKVIEIQPDYQNASAYDALAQIELKAGFLGGGKPEKAIEYLEKALEIEKDNTYIYLHLAQAYLAVKRDADAKKQLEYLLKMRPKPDYVPEYRETTEEAKELLKRRF